MKSEKDLRKRELAESLGIQFDEVKELFGEETLESMMMSEIYGGTNIDCTNNGCNKGCNHGCKNDGCNSGCTNNGCNDSTCTNDNCTDTPTTAPTTAPTKPPLGLNTSC